MQFLIGIQAWIALGLKCFSAHTTYSNYIMSMPIYFGTNIVLQSLINLFYFILFDISTNAKGVLPHPLKTVIFCICQIWSPPPSAIHPHYYHKTQIQGFEKGAQRGQTLPKKGHTKTSMVTAYLVYVTSCSRSMPSTYSW